MDEIALHILDIVQNSIAAGAAHIDIEVLEDSAEDCLTIIIGDDGCGMDEEMAERAQDPFTTSRLTRKVGLGIPLFKAGCLACEGTFSIVSKPGRGTTVTASYKLSHIDRPPVGNLADTIYLLVAANPQIDFSFRHSRDGGQYRFNTTEVRQALDGVPLDNPDVQRWIRDYLDEAEKDLHGGATIQ